MKLRHTLFLLAMLLFWAGCDDPMAPGTGEQWMHFYGTEGDDYGLAMAVTNTNSESMVIAGQLETAAGNLDIVVLYLDANGGLEHMATFGGPYDDSANEIVLLPDGGLLLAGSYGTSTSTASPYLLRLGVNRDSLWSTLLGGTGTGALTAVDQLSDGSFAVTGTISQGLNRFYVAHVGSDGALDWENTYPNGGTESKGYALKVNAADEILVTGTVISATEGFDAYTMKLTSNGSTVWALQYDSTYTDEGRIIDVYDDGTVIVAGHINIGNENWDLFIHQISATGQTIALETINLGEERDRFLANEMILRHDTLMLPVTTESRGVGSSDLFFLSYKLGGESLIKSSFGGTSEDIACAIVAMPVSKGYAMCGFTKSFSLSGDHDIVVLRINETGQLLEE